MNKKIAEILNEFATVNGLTVVKFEVKPSVVYKDTDEFDGEEYDREDDPEVNVWFDKPCDLWEEEIIGSYLQTQIAAVTGYPCTMISFNYSGSSIE